MHQNGYRPFFGIWYVHAQINKVNVSGIFQDLDLIINIRQKLAIFLTHAAFQGRSKNKMLFDYKCGKQQLGFQTCFVVAQ